MGHPTSSIKLSANLDLDNFVPALPFDPTNPALTSNFSTGITAHDAWGRPADLTLYFARTSTSDWDYHVLLSVPSRVETWPSALEIGTGSVSFEIPDAPVRTTVGTPLRLPGPIGFEAPEISLDFGGLTNRGGPSEVLDQEQNGNEASFAADCSNTTLSDRAAPGPEELRGAPVAGSPACLTGETLSFFVGVNLPATAPVRASRWNSATPLALRLSDRLGRVSTLLMYFRHASRSVWSYQVVGSKDDASPVLGAGELSFNDDGSLLRVNVSQPLSYAEPDGESVLDLGLDFGWGTETGGSGVDGSTAFGSAPIVANVSARGAGPNIGQPCADSTLLLQTVSPSLDNSENAWLALPYAPTRSVFASGNLPASEPLRTDVFDPQSPAETSSFVSSVGIYDADGRQWLLTFYARHVGTNQWQYIYVATSQWGAFDTGIALLEFDVSGRLLKASPPLPLRVPLSNGRPGPVIDMPGGLPVGAGGNGYDWLTQFDGTGIPAQLQMQIRGSYQQALAR